MLAQDLKELLATQISYAIKAQFFHWNVEGSDFGQLHDFFGTLYTDAYGVVDQMAEYIRTLDEYAPGSLTRFIELSHIEDQVRIPSASLMLKELTKDNDILLELLQKTFDSATAEKKDGIADFLAGRLDMHGKWRWQLKAFQKV